MKEEELIAHFEANKRENGTYNVSKALKSLGKSPDDKSTALKFYKILHRNSANFNSIQKVSKLKRTNTSLQKELSKSENSKQYIFSLMQKLNKIEFDDIPNWVDVNKKQRQIVPFFFDTDTHYGETINLDEMGGLNFYNTTESNKRVNYGVDKFIEICENKKPYYSYDGVVYALGGDNITGSLHDLAETNDATPIEQVIGVTEQKAKQISKLKKAFGKVFVPGVTGNHGRLSDKMKTKRRANDSLETLVFANLKWKFKDDPNVSIVHKLSDKIRFSINGRIFELEHGDGYKYGGGVGGITVPIKRGITREHQSAFSTNSSFHTKIIGHFHQHHIEDGLIIGNSPKGYDEYCVSKKLPYGVPGFTTFMVNSHGDIVDVTNIKIRLKKPKEKNEGIKIW